MRLIVQYSVGDDCTYSCEIINPLVYSSKKEAIIDFGSKILEIMEDQKSYNKAYNQWENKLSSISTSNLEKRSLVFNERPQEPTDKFNFGGCNFWISNFVSRDYESGKETVSEPNFYTVDEWFSGVEK